MSPDVRLPSTGTRRSGLLLIVAALVAWAYTLTVLTPAMPVVARTAPTPGGDGEIFLWVAELRWAAILLAALGLLTALAGRRAAPLGPVLLTVLLLAVDGVLARTGTDGGAGLTVALVSAVPAVAVAGWVAARPGPETEAYVVRRRLVVVAILAAGSAPLPLFQGTPSVNREFLPAGLPVVTALLPALLTVLAAIAVGAARPRPLPLVTALGMAALPALALAGFGLTTGWTVEPVVTSWGVLLAVPLVVLAVALLWPHPAGRRVGTVVRWTAFTLVGVPASTVLVFGSLMISMVVSSILFEVAGTSYPADGVSVIPGALLLGLAVGLPLASRIVEPVDPHRPLPVTDPGPRPAPPPAVA